LQPHKVGGKVVFGYKITMVGLKHKSINFPRAKNELWEKVIALQPRHVVADKFRRFGGKTQMAA